MTETQTLSGATSIASAAAALAKIKDERDRMNAEQAELEIPLLEGAIEALQTGGAQIIEISSELQATIIHPMAKEHLGHLITVLTNVPATLLLVVNEHKAALAAATDGTVDVSGVLVPVAPTA